MIEHIPARCRAAIEPMLCKTGLRSYAFEMGTGIRQAVERGATVVNVSAGYPCKIVTNVGLSLRICGIAERAAICTALTAALHAAAALAGLIPFVGPIIVIPLLAAATATSLACFATLLIGDPRSPMEDAVAFAMERGVTVVSIAGNQQSAASLGALADVIATGTQDCGAWEVVPGVIPGVICAGACDPTPPYANNQYFGDRVDLWAPTGEAFWRPPTTDAVTAAELQVRQDNFGGTSAAAPYITGVIAMMQAANPALDPRRAPAANRRTIPQQIAGILRSTATPRR